jgi:hypothetical protein
VTVVAAFKLNDFVTPSKCPHQADNCHTGFGARINKSHHLNAWDGINHH